MTDRVETVIIGGGQARLAMSYHLSRLGREHVILEEKWPGHRWRTKRWDAFALQAPNWTLQLPGYGYQGDDPDGFVGRDEAARFVGGLRDVHPGPGAVWSGGDCSQTEARSDSSSTPTMRLSKRPT